MPTTVIQDTFTGTNGTLLTAHTGETGATWTVQVGSDVLALNGSGGLKVNTTSTFGRYKASGTSSDNYVTITLTFSADGTQPTQFFEIVGWSDSAGNNLYFFRYFQPTGKYQLSKAVGGVTTLITEVNASAFPAGTHQMRLILAPGSQTCQVKRSGESSFSTVISQTDTAVPHNNLFGLGWQSNSSSSWYFDEFTTTYGQDMSVSAPIPYQTYQVDANDLFDIAISGTQNEPGSHDIEASWNGGAYSTIATGIAQGATFSGTLTNQMAGQGTLSVRLVDAPAVAALVNYVGGGDVYAIWGQSNASGRFNNNQTYKHPTLKVTLFGNDNVWHECTDPTDSNTNQVDTVSSDGATGSIWPNLATCLMANLRIPIAFVPCAKAATAIANVTTPYWLDRNAADHFDRTKLYGSAAYRTNLQNCKAILMIEGESDALASRTQAQFKADLATLAARAVEDCGIRIMPAKFAQMTGYSINLQTPIWAAIQEEWDTDPNVIPGPDLSDLTSDADGGGTHMTSDTKAIVCAERFFIALWNEFYTESGGGGVLQYPVSRGRF